MSKLQDTFIEHFKGEPTFTTKEVYEWYKLNKTNPNILPQRIAVHTLIINPLVHKGRLTKIARGVYTLVQYDLVEKDEWDEYLQQKLCRRQEGGDTE